MPSSELKKLGDRLMSTLDSQDSRLIPQSLSPLLQFVPTCCGLLRERGFARRACSSQSESPLETCSSRIESPQETYGLQPSK